MKDVNRLIRTVRAARDPGLDERDEAFLRQGVAGKLLTEAQAAALRDELRERELAGRPIAAAELAMEQKLVTPDRVAGLLAAANRTVLVCSSCHRVYDVSGHPATVQVLCLKCGEELRHPKEGELITGQGPRTPYAFSSESSPAEGLRLGKYLLKREVARGGMGIIYEAMDDELRRRVALKILREGDAEAAVVKRLHREAAIAARLQHPNIVTIHEVGMVRDTSGRPTHFIAMDFVEGRTLVETFRDAAVGRDERLRMIEEVARAVAYAHSKGVVHRDLKPANVLVDGGGRVLLTDFGLARAEGFNTQLTQSQAVMGTPHYMAPEQVQGRVKEIDGRTDVWALGVMLYEAVTGRWPFHGTTAPDLYDQILRSEPSGMRKLDSSVTTDLEVVCLKALEKEPARRYATALDLAEDLSRVRRGDPIEARRPSLIYRLRRQMIKRRMAMGVAAGLVIAALAVTAVLLPKLREREAELVLRQELWKLAEEIRLARPLFYVHGSSDLERQLKLVEAGLQRLEAMSKDPDKASRPELWTALGSGRYFLGDTTRAEEALLRAERLAPGDGAVNYYLGRVLLERSMTVLVLVGEDSRSGDTAEQARTWIDKALVHLEKSELGEIDRRVVAAYRSIAGGNTSEAIKICTEGFQRFPETMGREEFLLILARYSTGDVRRQLLQQALAAKPQFAWAHFLLATDLEGEVNLQGAHTHYTTALRINPWFHPAWINRAGTRQAQGDYDGAIADSTEAIRLDPRYASPYVNRGIAKQTKGDVPGAIADYQEALRNNPRNLQAHLNLSIAYEAGGDKENALNSILRAVPLDAPTAALLLSRARVLSRNGRWAEAAADFDKVIALDAGNAGAYFDRALARFSQGDLEGAVLDLDKSLGLKPGNCDALYFRGLACLRLGLREESAADLEQAFKAAPADWVKRVDAERLLKEARQSDF